MYDKIFLKHGADRKVFVTSDSHLGHDREFIYGPRNHPTVHHHDGTFERLWNEKVSENDTVLHLGDVIFGQDADRRLLEIFKRLKFRELYLSPGNHNSGWRQIYLECKDRIFGLPRGVECYPLRVELRRMYGDQFPENKWIVFMPNYYEIQVGEQFIVCSHYPISSWNKNGKGAWMLSGHVHGRFAGSHKDTTDGGKVLDVGPESVGQAPISLDEVAAIMQTKAVKVVDHHGADTVCP